MMASKYASITVESHCWEEKNFRKIFPCRRMSYVSGNIELRKLSAGFSSTHGGLQVAQKCSMTTLPFRSVRCPGFPHTSRGKSCAVLPAIEASPCRYVGMAKSTKTSEAIAITAQAPIFRTILIKCYTNPIAPDRETILPHPIHND